MMNYRLDYRLDYIIAAWCSHCAAEKDVLSLETIIINEPIPVFVTQMFWSGSKTTVNHAGL